MKDFFNLPDWEFTNRIQAKYGLNKGVYNEIDSKLYHAGIRNIKKRRLFIIHFLDNNKHLSVNGKLKFGYKKLTIYLSNYLANHAIKLKEENQEYE